MQFTVGDAAVTPDGAPTAFRSAALEGSSAGDAAVLGAYEVWALVEEHDLSPEAESPRAPAEAAVDLGRLVAELKGAEAPPADAGGRWLLRLQLEEPVDVTDFSADAHVHFLLVYRRREAAKGDDVAALRKLVEGSLPPAPKPRGSAQ